MPASFILAIIVLILALGALIASFLVPKKRTLIDSSGYNPKPPVEVSTNTHRWLRLGAIGLAALTVLLTLFASIDAVGTKNLGVLTSFGRPGGYLDNGLHAHAPWEKVTELNDATQTDTYASDESNPGKPQGGALGTCVHVRLARQATGCANVSIRWQIKASGVDYLFRNYKDNLAIQDNLVLRNLQQDMNSAFGSYDPLAVDSQGRSTNKPLSSSDPNVDTFSRQVQGQMRREIGAWIDVQSVVIPILNYDTHTQDKVNQLLQQVAATRIAQQSEQTAIAKARANEIIAKSIDQNPAINVANCINLVEEGMNRNYQFPPGWNCNSGTPVGLAVNAGK